MKKLKIELKSVDQNSIAIYSNYLIKQFGKQNLKASLIALPSKKHKLTLLRSPHVYKNAREQFEYKVYKKVIYLYLDKLALLKYFLINKPVSVKLIVKVC